MCPTADAPLPCIGISVCNACSDWRGGVLGEGGLNSFLTHAVKLYFKSGTSLSERVLMRGHNLAFYGRIRKVIPVIPFLSGALTQSVPVPRSDRHGPNRMLVDEMACHELCCHLYAVLQIRRGYRDKLEIISHLFFHKKIFCDPSLESSLRDGSNEGSNEGSQHMFLLGNKKNYL